MFTCKGGRDALLKYNNLIGLEISCRIKGSLMDIAKIPFPRYISYLAFCSKLSGLNSAVSTGRASAF